MFMGVCFYVCVCGCVHAYMHLCVVMCKLHVRVPILTFKLQCFP